MFRFESMCLKDQRSEGVVQHAWEEGLSLRPEHVLEKCIKTYRARLERWNKIEFGHVDKMIVDL